MSNNLENQYKKSDLNHLQHNLKDNLKEGAEHIHEKGSELADQIKCKAKEKLEECGDSLKSCVESNPIVTLGLAALAGAFLALLLRK